MIQSLDLPMYASIKHSLILIMSILVSPSVAVRSVKYCITVDSNEIQCKHRVKEK